jgi:hypothetical protein
VYFGTVEDNVTGKPVAKALVTVKLGSGDLAPIFTNDGTGPITGSAVESDNSGYYQFYVADGNYTLEYSISGTVRRTITDVEIAESDGADIGNLGIRMDAAEAAIVALQTPAIVTTIPGAYTAALGDDLKYLRFTSATDVAFTIPGNATVPFAVGAVIAFTQSGAGKVTLTPAVGVTLNSRGAALGTSGQFAVGQIKKVATNEWDIIGDVS